MSRAQEGSGRAGAHAPVIVSLFVSSPALHADMSPDVWRTPEALRAADQRRHHGGALPPLQEESDTSAHDSSGGTLAGRTKQAAASPAQGVRQLAQEEGYDGIVMELANGKWRERWERLCLLQPGDEPSLPRSSSRATLPTAADVALRARAEADAWRANPHFQRAEVNLVRSDEVQGVTLLASQWIELDAADEGVRLDAELALRQELAYAAYLGATHVVLPAPSSEPERRPLLADYARAVRACVSGIAGDAPLVPPGMTVSVRLPVSSPHILTTMLVRQATRTAGGTLAMPAAAYLRMNDNWAWETWETLQTLCGYSAQLHVALDLSMPLPPASSMARWQAGPVSLLWLPSSSFLANAKGYPVLSKSAQSLLRAQLRRRPTVVLSDVRAPPPQHTRGGASAYLQYVRHLDETRPPPRAIDAYAGGYDDFLQAPLQPMADNLSAHTYTVFESDPVKYALYEEALFQALAQLTVPGVTVRVWVVGAGRGALVDRVLAAADRASRVVHATAVEKNPGVCIALQDRVYTEWGTARVSVLQGDMRTLPVPSMSERADIVVSELLGSFGDNELAPECLDGAMRFLKPNGISIPSSYLSYMAPVSAPLLHAAICARQRGAPHGAPLPAAAPSVGMGAASSAPTTFDAPYVVRLESASRLSRAPADGTRAPVQPCWRFEHTPMESSGLVCGAGGLPTTNSHNARTASNTFYVPYGGMCDGLAGYFEAHLFGNVILSIFPDKARASADMVSWFPIYFPFRQPLFLPADSELSVRMWRLTDDRRVWYEWCAESFLLVTHAALPAPPPAPAAADDSRMSASLDTAPAPALSTPAPAFSNAAHTPMLPSSAVFGAAPDASADPAFGLGLNPLGTPVRAPPSLHPPAATDSPHVARASVSPALGVQSPPPPPPPERIKIGQTALMNGGAVGSSMLIHT
ncbi:type II protein arginine methyltransferase [Malassezia sp. CBS 17886]|nr:type II protein arginine methyltransferase [Malassezia sp. CBS 17886]